MTFPTKKELERLDKKVEKMKKTQKELDKLMQDEKDFEEVEEELARLKKKGTLPKDPT